VVTLSVSAFKVGPNTSVIFGRTCHQGGCKKLFSWHCMTQGNRSNPPQCSISATTHLCLSRLHQALIRWKWYRFFRPGVHDCIGSSFFATASALLCSLK
jgi:hypothetical protein